MNANSRNFNGGGHLALAMSSFIKSALFATLMLTLFSTQLWAVCTWCTSVTETCCDNSRSDSLYALPCDTKEIYYQYNGPASDWVEMLIFEKTGQDTFMFLVAKTGACDCSKGQIYSSQAFIPAGTVLKFSVYCSGCPNHNCENGNITVKFYTPSLNNCAPTCIIQ